MSRICVLSDTHDNLAAAERALVSIAAMRPAIVIHCGDIVSPAVMELFRGLPAIFVFGNNDDDRAALQRKARALGFAPLRDELAFAFSGKEICVYHGTLRRRLEALIASQDFDYVLTGHTHRVRNERIGRTRVLNPGALFRASRYTFAVLDAAEGGIRMIEVPK